MDKITKRIEELTDEINNLLNHKEEIVNSLRQVDKDITIKTALVFELKAILEDEPKTDD